ncbi:MAG: RluA family pseudouridine synthase [Alphaproteobacteria bacterium]
MTAGCIHHEVRATPEEAGARIDKGLARALPQLSRARIQALIRDGRLVAGGATITDPARRVKPGQHFVLACPPAEPPVAAPESIPLVVLYEDDELIVIDKPAGMVVHPAPGNPRGTLVNALIAHCGGRLAGVGGVRRPGIVHRIDKETSGLIVAAKTDRAHHALARQFAGRTVERRYLAIAKGRIAKPVGTIEGEIGRDQRNRKRMAVVGRGGKPALTHYKVLGAFGDAATLVECRLGTGRTHQIRVHLAALGHPLVGDRVYGRPARRVTMAPHSVARVIADFPRQALHAATLGFEHPLSSEKLSFESNLPPDMAALITALTHAIDAE